MKSKPIIAISIGDPNGIGTEIILKSLDRRDIQNKGTFVIFCPWKLWLFYKKHFNIGFYAKQISNLKNIIVDKINVFDIGDIDFKVQFGESTKAAGNVSFKSLEYASQAVLSNHCQALVTAPINKANIQSEGFNFHGHTEYLEHKWGGRNLMFMVHDQIKVGLVTQHIPLKDVPNHLNQDLIIDKFKLIHKSLQEDFNITNPVIAVLGLNPHAGDAGLLGKEEIDLIIPTINKLIGKGYLAYGPFPADSFFNHKNLNRFDAVLSMYHDQGLIPFKTIAGIEGINYTAGLPFVRTSPDHGVGYDIAGQNIANEQSFVEAIYSTIQILENKNLNKALKDKALKISNKR